MVNPRRCVAEEAKRLERALLTLAPQDASLTTTSTRTSASRRLSEPTTVRELLFVPR